MKVSGVLGYLCAMLFTLLHLHPAGFTASPPSAGICSLSVAPHGYKCEEFEVTTDDGYILSIQRIPDGLAGSGGKDKPPVLLQHGVLVDGMTWFLNSRDEDLPLILAENGFDVWIANTRGTRFCRRHATLDPAYPEFWDWSWDEMVAHDLPAVFDFVFRTTGGRRKISYVGHSMGTLILLASLSERKLLDKLNSAALLSPVFYLSNMSTSLGVVAARSFLGEVVRDILGISEFDPKGQVVAHYLDRLCREPRVDCYNFLNALTGKNCCLNTSTVESFLRNEPQSTSTKTMVHLAQIVRRGVVAKYDYGDPARNTMRYGEATPPAYDPSNIPADVPLFLSYGGRDALSDARDVQRLLDVLKLHDEDKLAVQFIQDYAHADFIIGVSAKDVVYKALLSFFKRHSFNPPNTNLLP